MNKYVYLFILLFITGKLYGQSINHAENQNIELSLNGAIEISLMNHPVIHSSRAKIDATRGRFWSGVSLPQPELSASYEYIPTGGRLNNFSERTIGINQSIEFPSNYILRGIKISKEQGIAEHEYSSSELNVISQVKTAYYRVLSTQEQLTNAQENRSLAEDFYKKAEIRYNAGEGTNLELLTAKVQYTEAQNSVEIQKNHLIAAFAELQNSLGFGKDQSNNLRLIDTLRYKPYPFEFDALLHEANVTNPSLNIERLRVSTMSIDRTLAWSSFLPSMNLAYYRQERDGNSGFYGASVGLSVPLWFMFDQRGKIQEAAANVSLAESELQKTQNSLYLKIKTAFTEFKNEEKQVLLYQTEILSQANEIYRTASSSYEAGEISYLEYLQAKQTIIHSRTSYIQALLSYNLSLISLEEAVGKQLF